MAVAGCINAYDCSGTLIRTLECLQSSNIGVGVQYCAPNPLDDKRLDYIKYTDKCGCTCCLSAENEILIYATNGVIKNLTLTNDDANEAIKIQWNDIFGSNRVKTVVRYKTGSYPVSITDGTLAVEETTKNQYSSTPFSLSGVLDETTYYISAFAVDSNGTIIDVQSMSITTYFKLLQVFDFQNDGALSRTGSSIGYGTPAIASGQGWYIGNSSSGAYQGNITPPNSIYKKTLKSIKIYGTKPQTTTSGRGSAFGIVYNNDATIEYGRNHGSGGRLGISSYWISTVDLTGEITMEIIFEDNGDVNVKLSDSSNTYTYNGGNRGQPYKTAWENGTLGLMIARWSSATHYVRKVEILSV